MSKSRENRNHVNTQRVRVIRRALKEYENAEPRYPEDDHDNLAKFREEVEAALKSRSPR